MYLYMGYLNGQDKAQKGEKGEKGQGFALTPDRHIHFNNKRLTNLSAPIDSHDATTTEKIRHGFTENEIRRNLC